MRTSLRPRRLSPGGELTGDRPSQRGSAAGRVTGLSVAVCGLGLLVSAAVGAAADGRDVLRLGLWGLVVAVVGLVLLDRFELPATVRAATALNAVLAGWVAMIGISTVTYLLVGTFTRVDDALFESVAGFTTTALTVVEDLEAQGRGVLFWRALTQWLGGFSALVVVVAVLPFLGVGGPQPSDAKPPLGANHLLSPHVRRLLRQYLGLYVALSAVGTLLLLAGGMTRFDAVTYALTTVSTGGFGNHDASFAFFDSELLEWFGIGGMALAGLSIALVWRGLRGMTGSLVQSAELRIYVALLAAGSLLAIWWTAPEGGPTHDSVRHGIFSVVSAGSTTGHTVTDWGQWVGGAQVVLLVLMGIGAMSGSLGGGFRVARGIALVSYVWREVLRQLHPGHVRVVKVGRAVIDEELVGRMIGYQVLYVLCAGAGAFGLAVFGEDLLTSMSGAISALATVGPALGELSPGEGGLEVTAPARGVLVAIMFAGRLEIYPVLNALEAAVSWPFRVAGRAGRRWRWRLRR